MDYKISKIFIGTLIFFLVKINLYANIIYDKNNIIISDLDIKYYIKLHEEKYSEIVNNNNALKNLVKIKQLVINLKENNPYFLTKIDNEIFNEIGKKNIQPLVVLDILRYFKTKNEFIYSFFDTKFKYNDLEKIFQTFETLELPISNDNCFTIIKIVNLKNNKEFIDIFYNNLKKQSKIYEITINNEKFNVCINERNNKIIEKEILKYIEMKIKDDFDKFIYVRQNR